MKQTFFIELSIVTVLVIICIIRAARSKKEIARSVVHVLSAIVVPLLGNMIIASSDDPVICNAGYMLYLLGTNLVLFTLLDFTLLYCSFRPLMKITRVIIAAVLIGDSLSVFLNNFFMHCYTLEETTLETGEIYYIVKSGTGHYIHLGISAVFLLLIASYYIWMIFTSAVLYLERYLVIFLSVVFVGFWEYYNVLLDRTIDRSMIGLAVGGLLLYFFALEYPPVFLKMALHDLLVTNLSDAVLFFDKDGKPIYANKMASQLFGINRDNLNESAALLGEEITGIEFVENGMRGKDDFRIQTTIGSGEEKKYLDVSCQRMVDKRGNYLGTFFGIDDHTEVERERQKSLYRQTHDQLTGMVNREMFIDQVNQKLHQDPDETYVMILLDVADFKMINDIYGRGEADDILLSIANVIRSRIKKDSLYCRWGGDQFAVMVRESLVSPQQLEDLIHRSLKDGKKTSKLKYPIVLHAGYYVISEQSLSVLAMIDRCIMAIAEVHDDYQRLVGVYDDELRRKRVWEQRINAELPEAIEKKQIFPYLQPQYDRENRLTGAEVLVRWQHPEEGFLSPYRFIPIFEKNGMIVKVDT